MTKKKKQPRTIGELTNSRGEWKLNPVTRVKESEKNYDRKKYNPRKEEY